MAASLLVLSPAVHAAEPGELVSHVREAFDGYPMAGGIVEAAKKLFWALASMSLVWTMGMLLVRQDIGEALMELLRFMVVTGVFYWLLINASDVDGGHAFVSDIVQSFFGLLGVSEGTFKTNADGILATGLRVYFKALLISSEGDEGDRLLIGLIAIGIMLATAIIAAQFLLAMIMAWLLGYAAVFLLGFGGARWTSPIAINYYKHVLAIGIATLCLSIIGTVATPFLDGLLASSMRTGEVTLQDLGMGLSALVLLAVLSIRVPQLMYTLLTGSTLGLLAGAAGAVGSTIATGGSAAMAAAGRIGGGGGGGAAGGGSGRTDSATEAVQRSAGSMASAGDPFHVGPGSDPFGVPRTARQSGGSAFATPPESTAMPTTTGTLVAAVSAFGRDNGMSDHGVPHGDQLDAVPIDGSMSTVRHEHDDRPADPARHQPDYEAELSAISASRADAR